MKLKNKQTTKSAYSDSSGSSHSTDYLKNVLQRLKGQTCRDSTNENYYTIWKLFNNFLINLDKKPASWEDRIALF